MKWVARMDMQEQIKFGDHEAKGHEGDAGPNPGQKGPFVGEEGTRIRLMLSDVDPSPRVTTYSPDHSGSLKIFDGSAQEQYDHLRQNYTLQPFHLIYWDPPFFTGKQQASDFGSFSDSWPDLATYLHWIYTYLLRWQPMLAENGFLVVHCDWHAGHYIKTLGDQIFGYENFRNEIIWHYTGRRQPARIRVNAKHDTLLVWAKSDSATFYPIFEPWTRDEYIRMKKQEVHRDEDGREWIWGHQGRGNSHAYRIYLDEAVSRGRAIDTVWDIPIINTSAKERVGYPTQKPLALLTRLVVLCTQPGDWVWDPMMGSGTTLVAAAQSGRNGWGGDRNPDAIRIVKERVGGLPT